jgi:hypothetical protein
MRVAVAIILLCASAGCSEGQDGGAAPAGETRRNPTTSTSEGSAVHLDSSQVPADLRDLLPLAEKWGIGDDVARSQFQAKASQAEKDALKSALTGRNKRITQWLDSFSDANPMSDEAAAFMYMQLSLDEMGLGVD